VLEGKEATSFRVNEDQLEGWLGVVECEGGDERASEDGLS
jgi:hypothetical protein